MTKTQQKTRHRLVQFFASSFETHFGIHAQQLALELGWIEKHRRNFTITKRGWRAWELCLALG